MNYEGRKEWINSKIERLHKQLSDLQEASDYSEPGIYYEQMREARRIERDIRELEHQLEDMSDGEVLS